MTMTAARLPTALQTGPGQGVTRQLTHTPRRLRAIAISIALLVLIAGLVSALAVTQRQSATAASWQTAEPLMVTAQAIDTSLSDADTTAAASFLQGRIEPTALQVRYERDLTTAAAYVADAAQQAGSDPGVTSALRTLSTDLPVYAGIIQEANFNERQGYYPLAAAYMAEANNLMRTGILPAAAQVYGTEVRRLSGDQQQATTAPLVVLAVLAVAGLLLSLFLAQRWLSRSFHRTWNVALAAGTVIVCALGVWSAVAITTQDAGVKSAVANGSKPVSTFTDARILALRARADDELTLLTRDSDPTYQQDFARTVAALTNLLSASGRSPGNFGGQMSNARADLASYEVVHRQIRSDDNSGDLSDAVSLASASGTRDLPAVSAALNGVLAAGITSSQSTFDTMSSNATSDLDGLVWGLAIGAVLVAGLVLVGFQPRIGEYR
ncbi:MAG TPA: hypothetical protein VIX84_20955 [Acidimicrobiales bacterium]